jgi:hypothetical protein
MFCFLFFTTDLASKAGGTNLTASRQKSCGLWDLQVYRLVHQLALQAMDLLPWFQLASPYGPRRDELYTGSFRASKPAKQDLRPCSRPHLAPPATGCQRPCLSTEPTSAQHHPGLFFLGELRSGRWAKVSPWHQLCLAGCTGHLWVWLLKKQKS